MITKLHVFGQFKLSHLADLREKELRCCDVGISASLHCSSEACLLHLQISRPSLQGAASIDTPQHSDLKK